MTLDDIEQKLSSKLGIAGVFTKTVLFDFEDAGKIHVDGSVDPVIFSHEEKDADVTLVTTLENFTKILSGELDPNFAFMTGKLKVRGSMGLALRLNALLES